VSEVDARITGQLYELARLYRVQTAYYDVAHRRRPASADGLLAVLRALGAPVASWRDVPQALRERRQSLRRQVLAPVTVAWDGNWPAIRVCRPAGVVAATWTGHLELESGERRSYQWRPADLPVLESAAIEGTVYVVRGITLPGNLPLGYHRFTLEVKGHSVPTLIISAPVKAYLPEGAVERRWGTFLPLYALHTVSSWGSGDFASFGELIDWMASLGGSVAATLPLLPAFLDEPCRPSPYAPVSRLLWNEFYLDVAGVPEMSRCPAAQAVMQSAPFAAAIEQLHSLPLVDYRQQMALKRRILEELSRCLPESPERWADFQRFIKANPVVEDYARFRAVMEKRRVSWRSWPQPLRDGTLQEGDFDAAACQYHRYVQWLAHQQVQSLAGNAGRKGVVLYFDLPLGVHPDGYDAWRELSVFGVATSAGAPPDAIFTAGQDWQFPPLHPERVREQGYRYVIDYIRHHLRNAGMLRLDHVMGLHRLFWIPQGIAASQGVYVRYHAEEFYAILALESHRHRCLIIGEDLGIVPAYVRPAMARHGLQRLYVVNYELASNPEQAFGKIPRNTVASLNTHDMFPFAAYWSDMDIRERLRLKLLDERGARDEGGTRRAVKNALVTFLQKKGFLEANDTSTSAALAACLRYLSTSPARFVLINLEDLWGETRPQNVPSTGDEYLNWRNRARYAFEEFCHMPEVVETLKKVNRWCSPGW
jgi:4-alpha-glucanotransferase